LYKNLIEYQIINNFDVTGSGKKKKVKKEFTDEDKVYMSYSAELKEIISNTHSETENAETKKEFYSPEDKFETLQIPELNNIAYNKRLKKVKEAIFDFHIKNADDYVYEKIVID
jgi:hypothetical protein